MNPTITLHNDDCLPAMREMGDNQFDLAIVDPPYGIGEFSQTHRMSDANKTVYRNHEVDWNNSIPPPEYFVELRRVSKNQIIWGANYYNCFTTGGALVWDKENPHPNMSRCEIASHTFYRKVDYVNIMHYGFVSSDDYNIHPCQKPVSLYKWTLKKYAKEGDAILDTHLGGASIAIACHDYGFDLVGYELDAEYYAAAVKRLDDHRSQLSLDL